MEEKVKVLLEALNYIKKFYNKIIVIKFGGSVYSLHNTVFQDITVLKFLGLHPVLIHGGGKEINKKLEKKGKKSIFIKGLRYTDKESMKIVKSSLLKINSQITSSIKNFGGKARGFKDNKGFIFARKLILNGKKDLGYVGEIERIKKNKILECIKNGYIPVITSLGWDEKGNIYNINADVAASCIAYFLKAEKLIFLTDVEGIYENFPDKNSLIPELTVSSAEKLLKRGKIASGMIPKLNSCIVALKNGVKSCHIISGKTPHSLIKELLTEEGIGTIIYDR